MKKNTKKELDTSFFKIQEFKSIKRLYNILDSDVYTTYNQIIKCYENKEKELGIIIVVNSDDIFVQHLHLFCDYYGILLYKLPDSTILERKYRHIRVVGIPRNKTKDLLN